MSSPKKKTKQTQDARRSRNADKDVNDILGQMASGKTSEPKPGAVTTGAGSPTAPAELPPGLPPVIDINVLVTPQTVRGRSEQLVNYLPDPKQPKHVMLLPVSYSVPADAKEGDKLKLRGRVMGPAQEMPPPPPPSRLGGPDEEVWELRDQFRMRRLPWWVVFILAIYGMLKLYAVYDSPCAVLGVPSPASASTCALLPPPPPPLPPPQWERALLTYRYLRRRCVEQLSARSQRRIVRSPCALIRTGSSARIALTRNAARFSSHAPRKVRVHESRCCHRRRSSQ
jgi:hypothetical protein